MNEITGYLKKYRNEVKGCLRRYKKQKISNIYWISVD